MSGCVNSDLPEKSFDYAKYVFVGESVWSFQTPIATMNLFRVESRWKGNVTSYIPIFRSGQPFDRAAKVLIFADDSWLWLPTTGRCFENTYDPTSQLLARYGEPAPPISITRYSSILMIVFLLLFYLVARFRRRARFRISGDA